MSSAEAKQAIKPSCAKIISDGKFDQATTSIANKC